MNGDDIVKGSNMLIQAGCALMILGPVIAIVLVMVFGLLGAVFG